MFVRNVFFESCNCFLVIFMKKVRCFYVVKLYAIVGLLMIEKSGCEWFGGRRFFNVEF